MVPDHATGFESPIKNRRTIHPSAASQNRISIVNWRSLMFPTQMVTTRPSRLSFISIFGLLCALLIVGSAATGFAQITPAKESLSDLYPGKAYSPYAQRSFPDQVFWGDTHLHTGLSMDAGLFGARLGLDEAYRFARGEQVMASSGQARPPARLAGDRGPLRWHGLFQ